MKLRFWNLTEEDMELNKQLHEVPITTKEDVDKCEKDLKTHVIDLRGKHD